MVIKYKHPDKWLKFNLEDIYNYLIDAESSIKALTKMPLQRSWADQMQIVQLKIEVAGTSRIEGADFTDKELDAAMQESPKQLHSHSQRQAAATVKAYRWITQLPSNVEINNKLISHIHRLIITDADDDHCPPGQLRKRGQNVTFGTPLHRGVEGGVECRTVFEEFCTVLQKDFPQYNLLIQTLAIHYHFAAMHPFLDGNGRTARALEAFMLQKMGLKDTLFIAMSNYYNEEKYAYLEALARVRSTGNDLTPFLIFGLKGIKLQCDKLLEIINVNIAKSLYRDIMYDLFTRLKTKRKRVIADRQLAILNVLLKEDHPIKDIVAKTWLSYKGLKNPGKALGRDLSYLIDLKAIRAYQLDDGQYAFSIRLEWATEITETEFYKRVENMPKSRTTKFL